MNDNSKLFLELQNIMSTLRQQCPWDKEQTFKSLRNMTLEEIYEFIAELDSENSSGMKEELGDVLLHILFYCEIANEKQWFNITDVMSNLIKKLKRRHPHIYDSTLQLNTAQVIDQWEKIKKSEGKNSVVSGIPTQLPSILKALLIQKKAAQLGFDWKDLKDVWLKEEEEKNELLNELKLGNEELISEELGDWLFSIINISRHLNINPDLALEKTNQKFSQRLQILEQLALEKNMQLNKLALDEQEQLWQEAKKILSEQKNK
ncbi:MAG: nucleoside triphosphate pyrophosphohydrolase [Sediminibacterium sp.]|nr:nucleoside triphosphate pyrophosphohydrolase [Sediminibacterium sp.]